MNAQDTPWHSLPKGRSIILHSKPQRPEEHLLEVLIPQERALQRERIQLLDLQSTQRFKCEYSMNYQKIYASN
jgi:hypothetical protein